jgi:hypothetical protein
MLQVRLISLLCCLLAFGARAEDAPGKLPLKLSIERPAAAPVLLDAPIRLIYRRPIQLKGNEPPGGEIAKLAEGANTVDLTTFPDGQHFFYLERTGCAAQWLNITVTNGECKADRDDVTLYRTRYVVIRYAWNKTGKRNLTGDGVQTGRVAITHWGRVPNIGRDWQVWQGDGSDSSVSWGDTPELSFHRIATDYGFADAPEGAKFDDLAEAPDVSDAKYQTKSCPATSGLLLLCRVSGDKPDQPSFGKILVEDVTFTPPAGVKLIERK